MRKAYEHVAEKTHVDSLLVDGNKKPDVPVYVKAIVKGDAKIPEIMAASILAKTERDRIMKLCDAISHGRTQRGHIEIRPLSY